MELVISNLVQVEMNHCNLIFTLPLVGNSTANETIMIQTGHYEIGILGILCNFVSFPHCNFERHVIKIDYLFITFLAVPAKFHNIF